MHTNYAYESKFQKFYLIRIIQLFEDKTLRQPFKEIKLYSNNQTPRKQNQIQQQSQQVYDGEMYISTKELKEILESLPKLQTKINLSEHFKKKIGSSQKCSFASVKETISLIKQKNEKQLQEIQTERVINNFLKIRSMGTVRQNQIHTQSLETQENINHQFNIKFILVLIIILFYYLLDDCYIR
ncbi:unnamed protein product (macronuclear) [Paramecium tetraurelia]|uniref:Transmembrane protein n=1 Tax=Paramecium tetraurelia TaxID=5888 RepID=A0CMQ9_PARTE|nr:uncharacterized protein GSPATT00008555001 [Paramecium tetraurelia]CAK72076.1 unnamed protein product [Paramecium tetraurelia]|eukprot:XP_001439473.1 hypothetical protein (macronuclear) [Paramecium tetraurelia strain d4-2]